MCLRLRCMGKPCTIWHDIVYMSCGVFGMGYWMFMAVHAVFRLAQ